MVHQASALLASFLVVALTGCKPDHPPLHAVAHLVAAAHQRAGDPSTALVPGGDVDTVRRPVLARQTLRLASWKKLLSQAVDRSASGPVTVEVPIPRRLRTAPLRVQARLVSGSRSAPVTAGPRGEAPSGVLQGVEPQVVAAPRERETFTVALDGKGVADGSLLSIFGRPELQTRYESGPFEIPPRARLRFAIGIEDQKPLVPSVVRFVLSAVSNEREQSLFQSSLAPGADGKDHRWVDQEVDLSAYAGKSVRLRFTTSVEKVDETGALPVPLWGDPTIVAPAPPGSPRRRNLLLFSIDTLRADELGCYGYERPTTPTIDALLAAHGTMFTRAYASYPSTGGSHAAILTALDPCVLGYGDPTKPPPLREDAHTLGEMLRAKGYATAFFNEDGWISKWIGFARGFGTYRENLGTMLGYPSGEAATTFRDALDWIRAQGDLAWFAFVHTYQVHYPWEPPAGYLEQVAWDRKTDVWSDARARYDAEIRYTDDLLARFLTELDTLGQTENTLIVFLSDHGDLFGEHGLTGHGNSLFEPALRVPLILRAPGLIPEGQRIDSPVGLIDVAPTVLELLGFSPQRWSQGRSLVPLLNGGSMPERRLYAEVPRGKGIKARIAALDGDVKWIIDQRTGRGSAFDLKHDPAEEMDIQRRFPLRTAATILAQFREYCGTPPPAAAAEPLDPAVREKLKALGYLD